MGFDVDTLEQQGHISFEVWEVLVLRDDDESLRSLMEEVRTEDAKEWIRRAETTDGACASD